MDVYLNGKRVRLRPNRAIGKGGEADVFNIGGGQALKVFKPADHPDYQGLPEAQQMARDRIAEHQQKLRQFPAGLPERVVQPQALALDRSGQTVVGYAMPLLKGTEVLLRYCDRGFRQAAGIDPQQVVELFLDLHDTVAALHRCRVTIGDFNDLNVLVKGTAAYLIDADSFQYETFLCRVFTARFVDPILCDGTATRPLLQKAHSPDSDWYAFAVMLMQSLLFVGPYGGVYRPKQRRQRIPQEARPLRRITVFHPEVVYPKPALPYSYLPDALLHQFQQLFQQDWRGEFPRSLLESLRWTKCLHCGAEHARDRCPCCTAGQTTQPAVPETTVVRGTVTATTVLKTEGLILAAAWQGGQLCWLVRDRGEFRREDGSLVLTGDLSPSLQFHLQGRTTLVAQMGQVAVLEPGQPTQLLTVDTCSSWNAIAASETDRYWLQAGQLLRSGNLGPAYVGDVLEGQTRFWLGPTFGFGFYRAGTLNVAFTFATDRPGINDRVQLPRWSGQLIDATCYFSRDRAWFCWASQTQGQRIHHCVLIRPDGTVEASTAVDIESDRDSWIAQLHGHCAVANFLLVATDSGIVRIEACNGQFVVAKAFPDTEAFVDANSQLVASPQGIYAMNAQVIRLLKLA